MELTLPKRYHFSSDYSFFLHDLLAKLIHESEKENLFNVDINFKNADDAMKFKRQALEGEELWEWLYKCGYADVIKELSRKQVFVAVLADLCIFLYESLTCSEQGKLVVAYTLLRKPLKENLFILEWLLADPDDFSEKFHNHKIDELSISQISSDRKFEIISKALEKCEHKNWIDAGFIYELRYAKKSFVSYEAVWNQAVHLVTTNKNYKTTPENFNFVFSYNKKTMDELWRHYFRGLPVLLNHTVEVTFSLIKSITEVDFFTDSIVEAKRMVGFVLWSREFFQKYDKPDIIIEAKNILKTLKLECPLCNTKLSINKKNLYNFFYDSALVCKVCKTEIQFDL